MILLTLSETDRVINLGFPKAAPLETDGVSNYPVYPKGAFVMFTLTCDFCGCTFARKQRQRFCGHPCRYKRRKEDMLLAGPNIHVASVWWTMTGSNWSHWAAAYPLGLVQ